MAPKSVSDLAFGGQPEMTKSVGFASEPGYSVPKAWFNDPYALLDSMGLGYRANPSVLSYDTLRQMAEKNVIIAAIIQTRINQIAAFCQPQRTKYSVGFKIVPRNRRKKLTDSEKEYGTKLEDFMLRMGIDRNPERDSLESWTRKSVRDRLTFDQLCSEKVIRRNGKPHSIFSVPADTIRIANPRNKKGTPLAPWEQARVPKYVQVVDGTIVNEFTRREFIFRISNPRSDLRVNGYGFSELEMLIKTITSHLWAEEWNAKVFSQGATVKGILNVTGNIPTGQMEAFRRQWLTQVSGAANAWRTPILNSENLQWIPLQPSNNDMGYQQWLEYLIKIACAVFLIDPSEINFDTRAGVGQQPMFMTTNEAQQKVSKDRGLQPLLRFVQNVLNEEILWELDDQWEFAFVGLDARTEAEAIDLRMKELQSYKTLNEVRAEADDLPPVEHGDKVMNPVYTGMVAQKEQMAAQGGAGGPPGGAPGGPPGMPGMPPGPGMQPGQGGGQQAPNEAFAHLFSKRGGGVAPPFGHEERDAGHRIESDVNEMSAKLLPPYLPKDERTLDETSDVWEETIHASTRSDRIETALSADLAKALRALGG